MKNIYFLLLILFVGCKQASKETTDPIKDDTQLSVPQGSSSAHYVKYAQGFGVRSFENLTFVEVKAPWANAEKSYTYVLINKDKKEQLQQQLETLNRHYDAIIYTPVERVIATSTTHIPAFDLLEVQDRLIGFPGTDYISTPSIRKRIDSGLIKELGKNESLNEEIIIASDAELLIGFGISGENKSYNTLIKSGIPVVYNGDWVEETPLGKAEWIKFMGALFEKKSLADSVFKVVESEYLRVKQLAHKATSIPTVVSGSMFKDIWYAPAGESWLAQFFRDANASYLWKESSGSGSLSLNFETVLIRAQHADFWIGCGQYTSYDQLKALNPHYEKFDFFQNKQIYTYGHYMGETGGLMYYELAPTRPDIVLKDIIHILHPELLPNHNSSFFKPLHP